MFSRVSQKFKYGIKFLDEEIWTMALALFPGLGCRRPVVQSQLGAKHELVEEGYSCNTHNMIILCIQEDTHANHA